MGAAVQSDIYGLPTPREVFIGSKKFIKYGISPLKIEYVYNSRGKLVRLERIDPSIMDEFILTPETKLTEEQISQLAESANKPLEFEEDCPESTSEQLERFQKYGQERNKRRASIEREKLGIG